MAQPPAPLARAVRVQFERPLALRLGAERRLRGRESSRRLLDVLDGLGKGTLALGDIVFQLFGTGPALLGPGRGDVAFALGPSRYERHEGTTEEDQNGPCRVGRMTPRLPFGRGQFVG